MNTIYVINTSRKFKILATLVVITLIQSFSYAEENSSIDTESSKETKVQIKEDTINLKLLDKMWDNRQSPEGEQEIIQFIQNEPELPKDFNISWKVARLVYFSGNFSLLQKSPNDEKIKLFKYGYTAGLAAKELEPKRVEGYYWYAINLGSYGLVKGIFSALSNAKAGRAALLEAAKIDPNYQWCGPLRILGRYYQEVPGGIISFGDKKIAQEYFQKAIQTCPNFRLNTMYLGILKKKKGEKSEALELFKKAQALPDVDGKNEEKRYAKELAENIKSVQNM
jgi:tetratricopeptide (TPR) repeat protein